MVRDLSRKPARKSSVKRKFVVRELLTQPGSDGASGGGPVAHPNWRPSEYLRIFASGSRFRLAKLLELPVLEFLNELRRRQLQAGESLDQNRVANMLLFVPEEFELIIDRCHGRDASPAYGIHSSVQIRAMSEFEKQCHLF